LLDIFTVEAVIKFTFEYLEIYGFGIVYPWWVLFDFWPN